MASSFSRVSHRMTTVFNRFSVPPLYLNSRNKCTRELGFGYRSIHHFTNVFNCCVKPVGHACTRSQLTRSKRKWNGNDVPSDIHTFSNRQATANKIVETRRISAPKGLSGRRSEEKRHLKFRVSPTTLDADPLAYARRICEEESDPSPHLFTSAIVACTKFKPSARVDDALTILDLMMEHRIKRNVVTYNSLIAACANAEPGARTDDAFEVFELMESEKVAPDIITYSALIRYLLTSCYMILLCLLQDSLTTSLYIILTCM